jgi:hypothetical protein
MNNKILIIKVKRLHIFQMPKTKKNKNLDLSALTFKYPKIIVIKLIKTHLKKSYLIIIKQIINSNSKRGDVQ